MINLIRAIRTEGTNQLKYKIMKVIIENLSISDFEAWSGAISTKEIIINNNKENDFDSLIEELYPDGLTDTHLNDLLWHDSDWVLEQLGIEEE